MRGVIGTTGPHGTVARYVSGCHCDDCRKSASIYEKRRKLAATPRRISSLGTQRRIQALGAIGWSHRAIGERIGADRVVIQHMTKRSTVLRSTADRIAALYESMCMHPPVGQTRDEKSAITRAKAHAKRQGWAPPLAWDDIDNDKAPNVGPKGRAAVDLAEFRFLVNAGEHPARAAERLGIGIASILRSAQRKGMDDIVAMAQADAGLVKREQKRRKAAA
jgi:hypothetical protein